MANRWIRGTGIPLPNPGGDTYWIMGKSNGTAIVLYGYHDSTDMQCLATSTNNGVSWTVTELNRLGGLASCEQIAWNGTVWCVVFCKSSGGYASYCFTSPNGLTWTERTFPDFSPTALNSVNVAFSSTTFVAYEQSGIRVYQSVDHGVTWTSNTTMPATAGSRYLTSAWNGTAYCIGSRHDNFVNRGTNITTWSSVAAKAGWVYIIPGTSNFGLLNASGDYGGFISTDNGLTWVAHGTGYIYANNCVRASETRMEIWMDGGFSERDPAALHVSTDGGVTFPYTSAVSAGEEFTEIILHNSLVFAIDGWQTLYPIIEEPEPDYLLVNDLPVAINGATTFRVVVPPGAAFVRVEVTIERGQWAEVMMSLGPYDGIEWDHYDAELFVQIDNPAPGTYYGRVDPFAFDTGTIVATGELSPPSGPFWTGHRNTEES